MGKASRTVPPVRKPDQPSLAPRRAQIADYQSFAIHPLVAAWSGETDGSFCLGREVSGAGLRGVTAADIRQWSQRSPDRIVTGHRSWLGSFVTNVSWPSRRGSKHFENVRPAGEEDLDLVGVVRQTNTVDVGTGVNRVQDLEALLALILALTP